MSHLRPDDKQKHRRSDCKKGRHEYGEAQNIGGGIQRQVCTMCGRVAIDLTRADELTATLIPGYSRLLTLTPQKSKSS